MSHENWLNWTKKSLEGVKVQRGDDQKVRSDNNRGLSVGVSQQSQLSKVVILLVLEDLALDSGLGLDGLGRSFHDEIEPVACLALSDDELVLLVDLLLETVADLVLLVAVQSGEDVDLAEKDVVLLSVLDGGLLDYGIEGVSVETEAGGLFLGCDGGGSWGVVHQSQLSEDVA